MVEAGWPAPAKLNLFLHITGQRPDGYHLLQSVFQFLDRADRLHFSVRSDGLIQRTSSLAGVPAQEDLVVRAARALQEAAGTTQGADIAVEKILPMGGGLGGGSSDAATTLVALNYLWGTGLGEEGLAEIGLRLGADVPVFVRGRAAWAEGVGERLEPVELPEPWYLVLVPPVNISTAELFADPDLTRNCTPITIRDFLAGAGRNVFEPSVRRRYRMVAEALDWLGRFAPAKLTGTGACIFAPFEMREDAERVLARLPEQWKGFVAQGRNRSPLLDALQG
jgi:4-diphosphocytidyl-2-C-methyl-D-erythritol kinase